MKLNFDTPITGEGDIVSIDFHGFLTPEEVEQALWLIEKDPEEFGLNKGDSHCLAVEHKFRYQGEPGEEDGELEWVYDYQDWGTEESEEITRFNLDHWGWESPNCLYHPYEPSAKGLPPYLWDEHAVRLLGEAQFAYVCRECDSRLHERHERRTLQQYEEIQRQKAAGVPERMIYR